MIIFLYGQVLMGVPNEFILQEKASTKADLSKNELKQAIGDKTKNVFDVTMSIAQQIAFELDGVAAVGTQGCNGTLTLLQNTLKTCSSCTMVLAGLQKECVFVQKMCSHVAEKLLDNKAPFKKAFKKDLVQTEVALDGMIVILKNIQAVLNNFGRQPSKNKNTAQLATQLAVLEKQAVQMAKVHAFVTNDTCLKLV